MIAVASDAARRCETDDGFFLPEIKRHSLEKIGLHNRYANIFATGMRKKWAQLAYIGLYAGAGRARIAGSEQIFETSALAVLRQRIPFTKYIFVDRDPQCTEALRARVLALGVERAVTIMTGDVNEMAAEVRQLLPPFDKKHGLLSFCFVDPFDLQLKFETLRRLSDVKMDFLVLLMLGVDGRRNFRQYLFDQSSRIGDLTDCANWRDLYRGGTDKNVIRFLLRKFDEAMVRAGYLSAKEDLYHPVKIAGMGVLQYVLAFYSKDKMGQRLWRQSRASVSPQIGFGI